MNKETQPYARPKGGSKPMVADGLGVPQQTTLLLGLVGPGMAHQTPLGLLFVLDLPGRACWVG